MTETDAERFRKEAEDCRAHAEKAISPLDRDEWLRLAGEWLKLAVEAKVAEAVGSAPEARGRRQQDQLNLEIIETSTA